MNMETMVPSCRWCGEALHQIFLHALRPTEWMCPQGHCQCAGHAPDDRPLDEKIRTVLARDLRPRNDEERRAMVEVLLRLLQEEGPRGRTDDPAPVTISVADAPRPAEEER